MPRTIDPGGPADDGMNAGARLDAARENERRLERRRDDARGTSTELATDVDLKAAREQVAAREAWLDWTARDYWVEGS